MLGFELWISDVGSGCSANFAITTAPNLIGHFSNVPKCLIGIENRTSLLKISYQYRPGALC